MRRYPFPFQRKTAHLAQTVVDWQGFTVAEAQLGDQDDLDALCQTALKGFGVMRELPSHRRHTLLSELSCAVRELRDEFAHIICEEAAKPIRDAETEVDRAVLGLSLAAEEARRIYGETLPLDLGPATEGRFAITRRFPVGPVLAITPYNFPLNLGIHKVAPALACGNSVIWKPSLIAPGPAFLLAELANKVGFPNGALTVAALDDATTEALARRAEIRMVSFTGSARVGWHLRSVVGNKRVALELGGNASVIIDETADLDHAVSRCVAGGFAYSGQVCISVQHVLAHGSLCPEFLMKLVSGARALRLGDPSDRETQMGPMVSDREANRVMDWISEALWKGAADHCGNMRTGNLIGPTVLTGVEDACLLSQEEAFGPVIIVEWYDDFDEALQRINRGKYGLQAGVFTRDLGRAMQAYHTLEVGAVIVNDVPTQRVDSMPYGGVKESGLGREGIRYAMDEMTEVRLLSLPTR